MNKPELKIKGYSVHEQLGRGGMAEVYLATQESLKRQVAIKVLLDSQGDNSVERFVNEAHFIASLNHPRIITIFDISTLENGDHYIAMEYLQGGDLREHFAIYSTPTKALRVVRQIAEGLALVHKKGIVHRDIKPANILFRSDGESVVTDFGIAKDVEQDTDLTQLGYSIGSPSYGSPEQAQNKTLDGRSDIYSLGVILLELLLGYNVFKGKSHTETAINHIQMPMPELNDHLAIFTSLLHKMLAKDPAERFSSCEELIDEIDTLIENPLALENIESSELAIDHDDAVAEDLTVLAQSKNSILNHKRLKPGLKVAGLVAALAAFYFLFIHENAEQKQIKQHLSQAQLRFEENKLVSPENDNARYYYRQVLLLENDNREALSGLERVKEKQIDNFLDVGMKSLEAGKLHTPKRDNAIHYFRKVLALDNENQAAKAGIQQVVDEYIRLANEAFLKKQYRDGHRYVARGLKLTPENSELKAIKEKYKDKKNVFRKFMDNVFR